MKSFGIIVVTVVLTLSMAFSGAALYVSLHVAAAPAAQARLLTAITQKVKAHDVAIKHYHPDVKRMGVKK